MLLFSRLAHPMPFLALLVLVGTARRRPLARAQWVVIGVYLGYLLPYLMVSYYERYAVPLLAAKVLLVVWAADRPAALAARSLGGSRRSASSRAGPWRAVRLDKR